MYVIVKKHWWCNYCKKTLYKRIFINLNKLIKILNGQNSFQVRQHDFQTGREVCGFIKVEEHTSCRCGCSVMAHHCSPMQHYKHGECTCECSNFVEKEICLQEVDHIRTSFTQYIKMEHTNCMIAHHCSANHHFVLYLSYATWYHIHHYI